LYSAGTAGQCSVHVLLFLQAHLLLRQVPLSLGVRVPCLRLKNRRVRPSLRLLRTRHLQSSCPRSSHREYSPLHPLSPGEMAGRVVVERLEHVRL
jgi:hypothetical protein